MVLSKVVSWGAQRIASLSLLALLLLVYIALGHDKPKGAARGKPELTTAQLVLVVYTLFTHLQALAFPVRLCVSTWSVTKKLKKAQQPHSSPRSVSKQGVSMGVKSIEMYEDSSSSYSSSSEDEGALKREDDLVLHSIILPNYKEDINNLRETLQVLACNQQASATCEVILAMEQGEEESEMKAKLLCKEFSERFRKMEYTIHPCDIPGEAQGKSSNLSWAARHVSEKYSTDKQKKNVIITVLDADSHLSPSYFAQITSMHRHYAQTNATTVYVPPIIFDRNSHLVPIPVRVADLLWAGAGLSGHHRGSTICPPTSVYSLPLTLVDRAGGWDTGPEAIGEDLHMYIKCFFTVNGNLTCRTVLSPASQTNVHTSGKGIRGIWMNCYARYRQALRHMWGALDSGYVIKSAGQMCWRTLCGKNAVGESPNWTSTITMIHRMYEAHCLPTHMTILIVGAGLYTACVPTHQIPPLMLQTFDLTGYIRLASLALLGCFFCFYETYHTQCVSTREAEMIRFGLADRMVDGFSYRKFSKNYADYLFFPISGVAFGSLPTFVALICQLWTLRLVYKVSKKPTLMGVPIPLPV
ncbi:hypothetical protein BP5796_00728 [Coleophoma crateriformis]|uniref:Glycosyltransferase 2-like domain-containing protein n=1 Tax=Coleophoma crateriformis TaxID=565419 RepID=A0A3D8T8V9_9HELO|nr:hypothetical protein BP5796_00728 [Coleophoma crateriformis]